MPKVPAGIVGVNVDWKAIGALALVAVGVWWVAKNYVSKIGKAVNPVSEENIFNKAFGSVYKAVTGSEQPLGADIYDWLHGEPVTAPSGKVETSSVAAKFVETVNPASEENVINKAFESAYKKVTGSEQSLGADLYDLFHKQTNATPTGGQVFENTENWAAMP